MAKILVVDDEPGIVNIVRFRLERDGHTVLSALDGKSGLALAKAQLPDLIVLDIMMPGLDGFEVLRQLKSDANTSHIGVILLTAKTDYSSVAKAWGMDADNYVPKPFKPDQLAQAVQEVLASRGGAPPPSSPAPL